MIDYPHYGKFPQSAYYFFFIFIWERKKDRNGSGRIRKKTFRRFFLSPSGDTFLIEVSDIYLQRAGYILHQIVLPSAYFFLISEYDPFKILYKKINMCVKNLKNSFFRIRDHVLSTALFIYSISPLLLARSRFSGSAVVFLEV